MPVDPATVPRFWDCQPSPGLSVGAGTRSFDDDAEASENLGPGIKLAILLEGCIEVGIEDRQRACEAGPSVNLFASRDAWRLDHRFPGKSSLRYLTMHLDAGMTEDLLGGAGTVIAANIAHFRGACPTAIRSITEQILHSPYSGTAQRLYVAGKSLELAALAIDSMARRHMVTMTPLASPAEVRRLHDLRDRLDRDFAELPTLEWLARDCGLNVRKMTAGFRRLFGQSIGEYLREVRLREGWRLLDSGMSVTMAAEHVGYTLPHFTTAFRRRFGIAPGKLSGSDLSPPDC